MLTFSFDFLETGGASSIFDASLETGGLSSTFDVSLETGGPSLSLDVPSSGLLQMRSA